jgi:hypothetical protein
MALIYNISELTGKTNFAEWILIANGWTNELLFTGFAILIVLVLFGIMITTKNDIAVSFTAANFLGLIISWLMWLLGMVYNVTAIDIIIPIIMTIFAAIGAIMLMIRESL